MDKNRKIGLRIHDIAEGLKEIQTSGPATQFKNTLLLGKAASLALHLKGHDIIENMEAFEYAAGELGIGLELEHVLRELEEIEFIRRANNKIEITVPTFVDAYAVLGERWLELKPKETELKTVHILNRIENNPLKTSKVISDFSMDATEKRVIYEIGNSGTYLDQFHTADGEAITFSPALTELNPQKLYNFSEKHADSDLSKMLTEVRSFQGIPIEKIQNNVVREACYSGILLQTSVGVGTSKHHYIFAPMDKVSPENKVILDKARAILSCVRHGEYHVSESTKIRSANLILNAMKTRKMLGGHPAHKSQYGLIITKGIARLSSSTASSPSLIIIDTTENMLAIDLATEMLGRSSGRTLATNQDVQQVLFQPDNYASPSTTRVRYKKEIKKSIQTQEEIIKKVSMLNQRIYNAFD